MTKVILEALVEQQNGKVRLQIEPVKIALSLECLMAFSKVEKFSNIFAGFIEGKTFFCICNDPHPEVNHLNIHLCRLDFRH